MTAHDTGLSPSVLTSGRRRSPAPLGLFALAVASWACGGTAASGQVYGPYGPSPIYQFGNFAVPWSLPPVTFGTINTGLVDFGVMNWYPAGGYNDYYYYNPYWYFQAVAESDTLALADYGLNQAAYNVQSMQSDTMSSANSMLSGKLAELAYLDPSNKPNHGDRYNIETGRAWSTGRSGGRRLVDMTSQGGDVLWPLTAPVDGDLKDKRAVANAAVRDAMQEFRGTGTASVDKVSQALRNLAAYANPAVDQLRKDDPRDVSGFISFVRDLDQGLRGLVGEVNSSKLPRPKLESKPVTNRRGRASS